MPDCVPYHKSMIKLMIVDDEMLMVDGIFAMLSDNPEIQLVAKVTNAHDAIAVAEESRPDIIIQDVLMRTGAGHHLVKKYCAVLPKVIVLGCSTITTPEVIEEMLESGARGYITKNEEEGTLEAAIHHLSNHKSLYLSPQTVSSIADPTLNLSSITPREREVLGHLCRDIIPKQVADIMCLSTKTVYNHIENIRRKAKVNNMIQLYILAIREGLAELPG